MNILIGLNNQQKQAVKVVDGPLLIIAGAGSGKTKVLTHRIAYLIQQGIPAKNILAVTFTNKAGNEMEQRIANLVNSKNLPLVGTFHSICVRILRSEIKKLGYKNNFVIYNEKDQIDLVKKIVKRLNFDVEQFRPVAIAEMISRFKDELIDEKQYEKQIEDNWQKKIAQIYKIYQKELKKINAVDFGDLIFLVVKLFKVFPKVLEKYQERFKYILVDEYQDTNHAQYQLINLLAKKYRNLCVCGDDWQSIYSWRGADFRNILNFEHDYPEAKIILLEENYRSTQNILDAGHSIIIKNTNRKEKKLKAKKPIGSPIFVVSLKSEKHEARFITSKILALRSIYRWQDFVILYRVNAQSRALEESLVELNLPYQIIGSLKFYERKEIKDILAYLKLLVNPNDRLGLERIKKLRPLKQLPNLDFRLSVVKEIAKNLNNYSLVNLINQIIKETGYERYCRDGTEMGEYRWQNVQELLTVAKQFSSRSAKESLVNFLEQITLWQDYDEIKENQDVIRLMTFHCAKGLEFPVVFIAGCEEGIFPYAKSLIDNEKMEEERRLCYVAITRAKDRVYMTFARRRQLFGSTLVNPPSRFIQDIPHSLVNFLNPENDETGD